MGTLKLIEADEAYRQNRDFSLSGSDRRETFDGMHVAIGRNDRAGKGLLQAHGSPLRRPYYAVFAFLL